MPAPAIANDTLFDDPCDQMTDYEVVLAESGGIQLAIALLKTEPAESGQRPHGIWGLFGIEAILSASGSPSLSASCGFLRDWGKSMNFRPSPSLIEKMKTCLTGIFRSRESSTEFPEALPPDAAERLAAMIRRIESLPVSSNEDGAEDANQANEITPTPSQTKAPSKVAPKPAAPVHVSEAPAQRLTLPSICASNDNAPPWWPALLEFTAKAISRSTEDDVSDRWTTQVPGSAAIDQMDDGHRFLSYIAYKWSPCHRAPDTYVQQRIQAEFEKSGKWPLDRKSLIVWLSGQLDEAQVTEPTPLECVLNPSILANHPESRHHPDKVKGEAYGAVVSAVSKRSPAGLGRLLPGLNQEHAQFFTASGPPDFRAAADNVVRILFKEWTGVPQAGDDCPLPEDCDFPASFWSEIKGLFVGELEFPTHFRSSRYNFDYSILFQALWSAWTAGDCTVESYRRIYSLERLKLFKATFNQIRTTGSDDPRVIEFKKEHERNLTATIRHLIGECLRNDDWENLDSLILDCREKRGIGFLSIAAKKLLAGATIDEVEMLACVEVLNPEDDLEEARKNLSALPQKTLKQLLPHTGLAVPIVLDLIEDRKFVDTLRVILGTFSEPLMPDTSDDLAAVHKATQCYHPGRAACGTTDFNPFYEAIAKCPKSVLDEIFKIVGNSIIEGGSTLVKLYAGLPVRAKDAEEDRPEIRALSRRLPIDPAERKVELNRRLHGLVAYVQVGDRPKLDFIFDFLLLQMRDAAYLWAEAAGQPTWTDAAFDMARRTKCDEPLELEDYTLRQSPQVHPGYTVAKKGKALKSLPPAIAKIPEARTFVHLAHFHRLMAMLLRYTFLSDHVRTGQEADGEFCEHHQSVLGIDPRDWLRERAALTLPGKSREIIRNCLEYSFNDPNGRSFDLVIPTILPDFRFPPALLFPQLLERHWFWEFDSDFGFYRISPYLGCGVHFGFSVRISSRNYGKQTSGRLPTEPLRLNLDRIVFGKEMRPPDDPIWNRLIDWLLQDLVLAASAIHE